MGMGQFGSETWPVCCESFYG